MKAVFLANFIVGEKEGIYKKIYAQARALLQLYKECYLVAKTKEGCKVVNVSNNMQQEFHESVLNMANSLIKHEDIGMLYVRAMIPSFSLIRLLQKASFKKIRIIYEIPTYPYFAEMFKMATKKHRAIIKIMLDVVFNPIIFHCAERILIVKSNSSKRTHKKMIEIYNGVDVNKTQRKTYKEKKPLKELNLVAVGTIYPYHGYDRLIEGMNMCGEKVGGIDLKLHFVGSSNTMNELEALANKYQLKNVYFYGQRTTEELNEMYDNFDIGVGCIGLHRKNADIDTSLKVIEYYCRGIPVISSAICPEKDYTLNVSADDTPIDMETVLAYYNNIDWTKLEEFSLQAREKYSWNHILLEALDKTI